MDWIVKLKVELNNGFVAFSNVIRAFQASKDGSLPRPCSRLRIMPCQSGHSSAG